MPAAITEITETICICYEVFIQSTTHCTQSDSVLSFINTQERGLEVSMIDISLMDFTNQNPLRWLPCIPPTLNCHSPINIGVEVLFHVITLKRAGIVNDFLKN